MQQVLLIPPDPSSSHFPQEKSSLQALLLALVPTLVPVVTNTRNTITKLALRGHLQSLYDLLYVLADLARVNGRQVCIDCHVCQLARIRIKNKFATY